MALSMFQLLLVFLVVKDVFSSGKPYSSSIYVHGVWVSMGHVCSLTRSERVVESWGYSLDLFLSILEVYVFALSADGRFFPLFIRSWLVKMHAVPV